MADLVLLDAHANRIAACPLRLGRIRLWHFVAFAALAVLASYQWLGLAGAGLAALGYYARWQTHLPPECMVVRSGCALWMCDWGLVRSAGWGRYHCLYRDELGLTDYVRLRRLLRRAALTSPGQSLDLVAFELV